MRYSILYPTQMKTCLIAGCGRLGTQLAQLLKSEYQISGITRARKLPDWVHAHHFDMSQKDNFSALAKHYDVIVYMAAADQFTAESYQKNYVTGVHNLLQHIDTCGRLIFISSTGVYAQSDGSQVTEDSIADNSHFSGQAMLAAENIVRQHHGICIRFAGIYGANRTRLINQVRSGAATLSQANPITNRIHEDDCVRVIKHLIDLDNPEPIYLACDDQPTPKNEVLCWLADALQCPPPQMQGEQTSPMRGNKRCSNQRLRDSGFEFKFPSFHEGYREILKSI